MMRKFQKGLAIFLILCLLVNGAAAHELSVSQELQKAFADCSRVTSYPAYQAVWYDVNCAAASGDLAICNDWIYSRALKLYYNWDNDVYRCCKCGPDSQNCFIYFVESNLWLDESEGVYIDIATGMTYKPPSYKGHGLFMQLSTLDQHKYATYTDDAQRDIAKFKAKMSEVGFELARNSVDKDKPLDKYALY